VTAEFLIRLDEEMLAYFREMVDVLVENCGVSRAEAVARINERYGRREMTTLERDLMTHELPAFWAYGAYYGPGDQERLPSGDAQADAAIDFSRLPVRPAPPKGSSYWATSAVRRQSGYTKAHDRTVSSEEPRMTDDAYLVLVNGAGSTLGVPPAAVGDLACMDTPAVQAWLHAFGITAASPRLRLVPPEATSAIPEDAERLPVPLGEEELNRVRHQMGPRDVARVEEELLAYRSCTDGRDALLTRALAAGVPAHRVAELTGEDLAIVEAAAR
jgi:hypothetical protein